MTGNANLPDPAHELHAVNRELACVLRMEPAKVAFGAQTAMGDDLVICGILGGKDVGKSTLINALAGAKVSADPVEVGRGTDRPMAYVHRTMKEALSDRLHGSSNGIPFDVTLHDADEILNAVLVDLPDFDSDFVDHLEVVRKVTPLLDRILWVLTPRKIGDRAWTSMFRDAIKDPANVHCVLNKVDELLKDADPFETQSNVPSKSSDGRAERFWQGQQDWMAHLVEAAGCPQSDEHRFLIAAAYAEKGQFVERIGLLWNDPDWARYGNDRGAVAEIARRVSGELDRLRSCVLSPVSVDEGRMLKTANRDRELQANTARIKRHYDLDRTVERLAQACDPTYLQQVLNEAMGPEFCAEVGATVLAEMRGETELADRLLERRIEHWPLLRLAHWPLGWLSRAVGRRVATRSPTGREEADDPLVTDRRSFVDRIDLVRSRILADHVVTARKLLIEEALPASPDLATRVAAALHRLPRHFETRVLDDISSRDRKPSIIGKIALWFVLLWFPMLQPILTGVLEMFVETGTFQLAHGLYRVVSALSATHLLAGFAVVAGIYVAILAGMYVRALRAVRHTQEEQSGASPVTEAIDQVFIAEVALPLAKPFQERFEQSTTLRERLTASAPNSF